MRSIKQPPMRQGSPDDFQTPPEALDCLIPYINKGWKIWECSEGKGYLSESLWSRGFNVVGSDILGYNPSVVGVTSLDVTKKKTYQRYFGKDFLNWELVEFDCIITNPPFSLKEQFLERCFSFKKPFALLLPLTTLESEKRHKIFREHKIQLIIPNKRFNFETPSGKGSGSWFATAWFCGNMNLPNDINFIKINSELLCKKQLNPIEEKELNTSHNSTFM